MTIADAASGWVLEFGKSAVTGAGAGSVAGLIGGLLYADQADGASMASCDAWTGLPATVALGFGEQPPIGCGAIVDLPVLGATSSLTEAAASYGIPIAIVGFLVALAVLAFAHHKDL